MNKDCRQTVESCDFDVFFARNQRFFKTKIKQRNKINDINLKKIKRVQRMNATEIIALTCKSNIENTFIACKNIIKIKKFKKLMIFKIIFKENKKILKFNNF